MNKKINKALVLAMAASMTLGLAACGGNNNTPPADQSTDTKPPVVEQEAPTTPDTSVETPEVETPEGVSVSMEDVVNTMKNTYGENYLPSMALDQESFNMMVGLTSDMYDEFFAEMPMMSMHVDSLFVVKTQDVDAVKTVFETYRQGLIEDTMQYPMNVPKIQNSAVYVNGDYVIFYMLGGYTTETVEVTEGMTDEEILNAEEAIQNAYYLSQMNLGKNALDKLFEDGIVPDPVEPVAPVVDEFFDPDAALDEDLDYVVNETSTDGVGDIQLSEGETPEAVETESPEVEGTEEVSINQ